MELDSGQFIEATPDLLHAIDEADDSFAREGGVDLTEALRIVASWSASATE